MLAHVHHISVTQLVDAQVQNYGTTETANANVELKYHKAVVDHHKDGSIKIVLVNATLEYPKKVVEVTKIGQRMSVPVFVPRKFHQKAVQVHKNGVKLIVNASVQMQEESHVQEIKDLMILYAAVFANHQ